MTEKTKQAPQKLPANEEEAAEALPVPEIDERIAELAYYKAESRGFQPGYELQDWLEAEKELLFD